MYSIDVLFMYYVIMHCRRRVVRDQTYWMKLLLFTTPRTNNETRIDIILVRIMQAFPIDLRNQWLSFRIYLDKRLQLEQINKH